MNAWIGTSGFQYTEWKGSFYPRDLSADRMLFIGDAKLAQPFLAIPRFDNEFIEQHFAQRIGRSEPPSDCCGGMGTHGSSYLGPEHAGVQLEINPDDPLPFASPGKDVYQQEQEGEFEFLKRLNGLSAVEYPGDAALKARIKSYELAFRMQMAVPDAVSFKEENEETKRLYGLDQEVTKPFGETCLAARPSGCRRWRAGSGSHTPPAPSPCSAAASQPASRWPACSGP